MRTRSVIAAIGCGLFACCGQTNHDEAVSGSAGAGAGEVIQIRASRWSYDPGSITLHKGVEVTLELTSSDVQHGFNVPGLGIRASILPGKVSRVSLTPMKTGTFPFHCDYYCGEGHEGMEAEIVVE